jgi:hypothetical protein
MMFCLGKMRVCRLKAAKWRKGTGLVFFQSTLAPPALQAILSRKLSLCGCRACLARGPEQLYRAVEEGWQIILELTGVPCPGPYHGPTGGTFSYQRGTPVRT